MNESSGTIVLLYFELTPVVVAYGAKLLFLVKVPFIGAILDTVLFRAFPPRQTVQDIRAMILIFQPLTSISVRVTLRLLDLLASCILLCGPRPVVHAGFALGSEVSVGSAPRVPIKVHPDVRGDC